jgi:hypothetical protein
MTGLRLGRKPRRTCGNGERLGNEPAWSAITIAERHRPVQRELGERQVGKRTCYRQDSRVGLQHRSDGSGGIERKVPRLAKENHTQGMVQLSIGQQDPFDWHVPNVCGASVRRKSGKLVTDVGRRVEEEPPAAVDADRCRRLRAGPCGSRIASGELAAPTPTIPLGKTTARGGPHQEDLHTREEKG